MQPVEPLVVSGMSCSLNVASWSVRAWSNRLPGPLCALAAAMIPRTCRHSRADHSGPGPAAGLQVTGETLDVGPAGLEQAQVAQLAPGSELPQVQRVGLPRQAGIAGQESCQHQPLLGGEYR